MAMIAGAVPGIACTGDQIPLLHGIAFLYANLITMGIQGAPPVFVAQKNQIAIAEKKELTRKLEDFKNDRDTMEEVFENREQIEISKFYEKQPKPALVAISEFEEGEIFYRMAKKEEDEE